MNAPTTPLVPAKRPSKREMTRGDIAFLPAALEILEMPASPTGLGLFWILCLLFAAVFTWSWFAKLDIFAVASGRIQMSGRSKVVQPLEAGRVKVVYVRNGAKVNAGDQLLDIDATETNADLVANASAVESIDAEIARRTHLIALVSGKVTSRAVPYPGGTSAGAREREDSALKADYDQFVATRESFLAQITEKKASIQRLEMSVAARTKLIAILSDRVEMKQQLVDKESGTRAALIDALQQWQGEKTNIAFDSGQIIETQAAIATLTRKLEQLTTDTIATQSDKLTLAMSKRERAEQDLVKATAKDARTRLTSPIDGTVQQLVVTSIGQVVTPGQPLLLVVPNDGSFEVEASLLNRDVGFVEPGQDVTIKIDSFPFTRYGSLKGRVVRVSRDAVDARDVSGSANPMSLSKNEGPDATSGTPKTQDQVFPVTMSLDRSTFPVDGREVALTPGMTVQAEIRTGDRRVIDYLLAPLRETTSQAAHER